MKLGLFPNLSCLLCGIALSLLAHAINDNDHCKKALQASPFRTSARQMEGYEKKIQGTGISIILGHFAVESLEDASHFVHGLLEIFDRHPYLRDGSAFSTIYAFSSTSNVYDTGLVFIDIQAKMPEIEAHLVRQYEEKTWEKAKKDRVLIEQVKFEMEQLRRQFKHHTGVTLYFDKKNKTEDFAQIKDFTLKLQKIFEENKELITKIELTTVNVSDVSMSLTPPGTLFFSKNMTENEILSHLISQKEIINLQEQKRKISQRFKEKTAIEILFEAIESKSDLQRAEKITIRLENIFEQNPKLFQGILQITENSYFEDVDQRGQVLIKNAYLDWTLVRFFKKQQKILQKRNELSKLEEKEAEQASFSEKKATAPKEETEAELDARTARVARAAKKQIALNALADLFKKGE